MKAQSELLGLAIAVLLITVGLLFFISFVLFVPQDNPREEFILEELSALTNDVLMETTIPDCRDRTVSNLLLACAQEQPIRCEGLGPCDYLSNGPVVKDILEEVFTEQGYKYIYVSKLASADASKDPLVFVTNRVGSATWCPSTQVSNKISKQTRRGVLDTTIRICT